MTKRRKFTKRGAATALQYLLLLIGGAVSVLPMVYMVSTSLKPNGALYEFPPRFLPTLEELTLENYQYIFTQEKFYINFLNSVAVTLLTVIIAALVATALAFCLARFRFRGRNLLFGLVIGTMYPRHDVDTHPVPARHLSRPYEQALRPSAVLRRVGNTLFNFHDKGLHRGHTA